MLYGSGSLMLLSKDLDATSIRGQQLMLPACIAQFELTSNVQLAEAKCLIDGKKQITAARITEETYTLKLTFEKAGWNELAFAFDELPSMSSNVQMPLIKTARVDATGNIIDTDITDPTDDIRVYQAQPISGFLKKVSSSGTPLAGEFKVATGELQFATSLAGAIISYSTIKTYTTIESIGEEANYDKFGKLIFTGEVFTTEDTLPMQIVVPELSRVSVPSLNITGSLSALDVEFRAGVAPGDRKPFKLFRKQGAL